MWNPESWALGSVIQPKESGIPPTIGIVFVTAFILFHQILPCLIRIINFSALFILVQILRVFEFEAQMHFFTYCLMPSHCCFLPHRFFCLTAAPYADAQFFNAIIYNHLQKGWPNVGVPSTVLLQEIAPLKGIRIQKSGIRENFACGIQNLSWALESIIQLKASRIP